MFSRQMFLKNSSSSWNWGKEGLADKALSFVFEMGALINAMPARPGSWAEKELLIILIGETSNFHLVRHSDLHALQDGFWICSVSPEVQRQSRQLQIRSLSFQMEKLKICSLAWPRTKWTMYWWHPRYFMADKPVVGSVLRTRTNLMSLQWRSCMAMFKAVSFQKKCWSWKAHVEIQVTLRLLALHKEFEDLEDWFTRMRCTGKEQPIRWPSLRRYNRRTMISLNPWRVLQVWELKIVRGIIQQLKHQLKTCWSKQRTALLALKVWLVCCLVSVSHDLVIWFFNRFTWHRLNYRRRKQRKKSLETQLTGLFVGEVPTSSKVGNCEANIFEICYSHNQGNG